MRHSLKYLAILAFVLAFAGVARGACSGSSPSYTAASASESDVQACVNLVVNGDTVHIPAGSATWSSTLVGPSNIGFTLIGAGTPNSGSSTTGANSSCIATVITDNAGSTSALVTFSTTYGNATVRLSCMDIEPTNQALNAPVIMNGTCTTSPGCPQARVDNITWGHTTPWNNGTVGSQAAAVVRYIGMFGVLDHNTLPSGGNVELFNAQLPSYKGVGAWGDNSWAQPLSLGGADNVFAENNSWNTQGGVGSSMNDCEAPGPQGCRFVIRYNTLTENQVGCFGIAENHGTETGGRYRSGVEMEVYMNTLNVNQQCTSVDGGLRGGTGMIWGNKAVLAPSQGANNWLGIDLYRNNSAFPPWGACGGDGGYDLNANTVYFSGTMSTTGSGVLTMTDSSQSFFNLIPTGAPYSVYDTNNVTGGNSTPFWSEVDSNTGTTISIIGPISEDAWAGFNNGDTYQVLRAIYCIDQPGRSGPSTYLSGTTPSPTGWPSEVLTPIYQLGDTYSGGANVNAPTGSNTGKVIPNRDIYVQTVSQTAQTSSSSPFNGTVGVGWGTLANRPASCTTNPISGATGVAYGETTAGVITQIDFCIATNTWSTLTSSPPSYVPYTYPHPLDNGTAQALAPSGTPTSGVVPQTVTVTNPNSGTTAVCYAASPTTPATNGLGTGCTTGTKYTSPITVSSAETLNLIAGVASETDSTVVSYTYSAAAVPPTVTTTTATGITTTTASAGGTVTATGGAAITSEGTCVSTSPNPIVGGACTSDGTATPFTSALGSGTPSLNVPLTPSTTYFYRSFAINSAGTGYGADLSFTTLGSCATPTTINGGYTACGFGYNDAGTGTSVTVAASPYAGNPVLLAPQVCGTGCSTVPPTVTVVISDNINNPETCFHASPHSPFAMAMPTVPDYETFWGYYAPDGCLPSGITSFTATFSASVASPQMDELELKTGQIATSGYFENVDNLQTSGGVAGLSGTVSTSGPTVNANDLIIAAMANCGATNPAVPGTGYTGLNVNPTTSFGTVNGHVLEAMGVATTGTKSAGFSWSSGSAPTACKAGLTGANTVSFGMIIPLVSVNGSTTLIPATNNFGSVNVGSSSANQTFTVTNNNATTATGISATTGSTPFPVTNTGAGSCSAAGGSLATGASCTITGKFSPSASGLQTATLTVSYSGGDGLGSVTSALSGTGVLVSAATPTASPAGGTFTATSGPVTLSDSSSGAIICYNFTGYVAINGAGSCPSGSTRYTGAFIVSNTSKLYIWAGGPGYADSPENTYQFTITTVTPPAPTLKIIVSNIQNQSVPITNSITSGKETATIGPQPHIETIETTCTCTLTIATGLVSDCSCPQSITVVN
jgi:hypothetical protein